MSIVTEHEIYKDIEGYIPKIVNKLRDAEKNKSSYPLIGLEDFIFGTFKFLDEIDKKLKDLDLSMIFISSFPSYKSWRKVMMRKEYILYHLEYFNINIIALFDRVLHLVNFLYDLGLSDRYVTINCITSNSNINKNLSKLLNDVNNNLDEIRKKQNRIKHKQKLKIDDLYLPSLIEFSLSNKGIRDKISNVDDFKKDMDFYYKFEIRKEKKKMIKQKEDMDNYIKKILDKIFLKYELRKKLF